MPDMDKIAQEVPVIMQTAAQHLTKMAAQNVELVKRATSAEHDLRLMKLARRMELRGLHPNLGFEEKVAQLGEVPLDKLAAMEQAVEMAAGGVKLPSLQTADAGGGKTASDNGSFGNAADDSADELESYIASQTALT